MTNLYETISKLRGTSSPKKETKPQTNQDPLKARYDAYAKLDDHQFAIALAQAEQNLIRMDHFGCNPNEVDDRAKVFEDILIVLTEAHKRFPTVQPVQEGAYIKDKSLSSFEALTFAYSKEAGKNDPVINEENKRIESWRQGKEYKQSNIVEEPFQNKAIYASRENPSERQYNIYKSSFKSPLEAARGILSQSELAAEKAKLAKLHIH